MRSAITMFVLGGLLAIPSVVAVADRNLPTDPAELAGVFAGAFAFPGICFIVGLILWRKAAGQAASR